MPRLSLTSTASICNGLKSQGWGRFLWLDVQALSRKLLKPDRLSRAQNTSRPEWPCLAAVLISADSDLIAPIEAVKRLFPEKRVIVACQLGRFSFLKIGQGLLDRQRSRVQGDVSSM